MNAHSICAKRSGRVRSRALRLRLSLGAVSLAGLSALACGEEEAPFDASDPARGPGELVGNGAAVSDGNFAASTAIDPEPADTALLSCNAVCEAHCSALSPSLTNPLDNAMCRRLWGIGLDTQTIDRNEACRRLFVDLTGRFPTYDEVRTTCGDRAWGDVVSDLIDTNEFVFVNQRIWADRLLYNNESVNVERVYDMDALVRKLYRGTIAYDEFASVVSAHPVLTRRYATAGDRAEALFNLFMGRPPYINERADMAKLYSLWSNGYYDHPALAMRVPDATIRFRCVQENGDIDPNTRGECTSVLWGYNELILTPDARARGGEMWSGLLKAEEWEKLQLPGKILSEQLPFWEYAVDTVVEQYYGYDLTARVPEVRRELMQYLLEYNGDIRALHHAVASSLPYLQTSRRPDADPSGEAETLAGALPWTYGPLKQVMAEPWIDSIKEKTEAGLADCDHRISRPGNLLESRSVAAYALVDRSRWTLDDDGVRSDYRDLATTLGGCPDNQTAGRFTAVSILSTAVQENFSFGLCNPTLDPAERDADASKLMPRTLSADQALSEDTAESIVTHQVQLFFSRPPSSVEIGEARAAALECSPKPCTSEAFARPLCYALLSSAEHLFY